VAAGVARSSGVEPDSRLIARCAFLGHRECVEYIGRVQAAPLDRYIDDITA
jgi:hypothetical protein